MLTYLKEKHNVDLRAVDNKNGTALHWAAYLGCEMATSVLLTWLPVSALNYRDKDGFTPLHHGTISGSTRIVRSILLKGANASIKDDKKLSGSEPMHNCIITPRYRVLCRFCDSIQLNIINA